MSLRLQYIHGNPKVSVIDSRKSTASSEIKKEKSSTSDNVINLLNSSSLYTKEEKDYLLEFYKQPVLFNKELANSINAKFVNHSLVPDSQGNATLKSFRQNKAFNNHVKKDKRITKNIIPIGDGLTICIKK